MENVSVEDRLVRWGGRNAYENIWQPLLRAKFDGGFDNVPATWIWSRLVRMKSTRDGAAQKEQAGHLVGGYSTLLQAMANEITDSGGQIQVRTPVQEIVVDGKQLLGIRVQGQLRQYDAIVGTMQAPIFSRLIPNASPEYRRSLVDQEYLGIVCPLLVLDRPLTGYWTLNITDNTIPFTGVIETTAYIDPIYVGGHHLVYLPKYTLPGSDRQTMSDEEIKSIWLSNLKKMFLDFDDGSIEYFLIHREKFVEPLHRTNEHNKIPSLQTPIRNLFLSTTAQIYPELTNGESVSEHARKSAAQIVGELAKSSFAEKVLVEAGLSQ